MVAFSGGARTDGVAVTWGEVGWEGLDHAFSACSGSVTGPDDCCRSGIRMCDALALLTVPPRSARRQTTYQVRNGGGAASLQRHTLGGGELAHVRRFSAGVRAGYSSSDASVTMPTGGGRRGDMCSRNTEPCPPHSSQNSRRYASAPSTTLRCLILGQTPHRILRKPAAVVSLLVDGLMAFLPLRRPS